ncbi:molybdenum cofactor guanylyltransferase MobA [Sulfuritalea sp.]|uniref:molybdenum cofactor guanylyltransferase MobA n=1 Tax=Sulfuritalea sp. TaxID=2480090 RepID=UPI001ACE6EFD|nr:molybdenum cofactor guanylyltransferase MobA [Sulfuritalea sp.]MBN8473679.1 molybdenum cofactor guanylyltransferase [Sulfuritalea sp.]
MSAPITGVILAGGAGRRMGGVDKGLQELNGQPLVQRVLVRLAPQVDSVLISANRNRERYAGFGCPVLGDTIPGYAGPLAGLQAALAHAGTPLLVSAPCDSPFLPADLVARLRAALEAKAADLAVARADGRVHRAFCLLRSDLRPGLDAFLASGERRVGLWHASLKVVEVDFDDEAEAFANVNTLEDLGAGRQS